MVKNYFSFLDAVEAHYAQIYLQLVKVLKRWNYNAIDKSLESI